MKPISYSVIKNELGPLISYSRTTIYDVMTPFESDETLLETGLIGNLSHGQVDMAIEYIKEHRERLESELAEVHKIKAEYEHSYRAQAAKIRSQIAELPVTPLRAAFYALRDQNIRATSVTSDVKYTFICDSNCKDQALVLFAALERRGYLNLIPMKLRFFYDVYLPEGADDLTIARFCQKYDCLFLSGDRIKKDGDASFQAAFSNTWPVFTISNLARIRTEPDYCQQCAANLVEMVIDLEYYRGVTRLYLPQQ
jgi:hypothetical protein